MIRLYTHLFCAMEIILFSGFVVVPEQFIEVRLTINKIRFCYMMEEFYLESFVAEPALRSVY